MARHAADGQYRSQPPTAHRQRGQTPTPLDTRTIRELSDWADDLPPSLREPLSYSPPTDVAWIRRVDSVPVIAATAYDYEGDFISTYGRAQAPVRCSPGRLVVLRPNGTQAQETRFYILLPGGLWYLPRDGTAPTTSWARMLRDPIRGWLSLTYRQRIFRACTEAIIDLSVANTSENSRAIEHFDRIRRQAMGEIENLSEETIRNSFQGWLEGVVSQTDATREEVIQTLARAMGVYDLPAREVPESAAEPALRTVQHIATPSIGEVVRRISIRDAQRFQ